MFKIWEFRDIRAIALKKIAHMSFGRYFSEKNSPKRRNFAQSGHTDVDALGHTDVDALCAST
jgi:hypothetical protein